MIMVTEDDKKFLAQYQGFQQQLQSILLQKENIKLQNLEIDKAIEELEASQEKQGFKIVGPIMVKKNVEDLKTELKEIKNSFDMRAKTLDRAEERLSQKLKEMQAKLSELLKVQ